uniref:NIN1 (RPN12) binding protein 1 homolog n=1 Tax=Sander lucioperca TaxID=283035 RepID=A0A8C9Y0M5_SANLU
MWWTRSGTNPPEESGLLPYTLNFKEPHPEHIRTGDRVSKKTGDYPSLSATDIKVLALTYQLELEHVGYQHLKKEPEIKVNIQTTQRHPETPVNVAGFHFPAKVLNSKKNKPKQTDRDEFNSFQFWREPLASIDDGLLDLLVSLSWTQTPRRLGGHGRGRRRGVDHASNIQQVKMESGDWTAPADVTVGCLTTDFAMQNVLIQMGLHVLSVNGMLIKEARNYILRCHAALSETTSNMSKVFCPHCGNKTLKKLAVTVTEDGPTHTHTHTLTNSSLWAFQHSLPLPRGGKHSNNPQLVEDQSFPQQRLSRKARQKTDVFDPDYVAGGRAANLQIRDGQSGGGRRRTNPNATHKKFVKKK